MPKEVHRQRIEKYLNAHGVSIEEYALMYLTRQLSDKSPQVAKEILKALIIKTKNIDILEIDDVKEGFDQPIPTQPVALKSTSCFERSPSPNKSDLSVEVHSETKPRERDIKIIRCYLSALLILYLIVGFFYWYKS